MTTPPLLAARAEARVNDGPAPIRRPSHADGREPRLGRRNLPHLGAAGAQRVSSDRRRPEAIRRDSCSSSSGDRLTPLGDGTWAGFVGGAADGLEYLFFIDGEASQGPKRDPYARELSLIPDFPASYCILRDPAAYPWHDAAWKPPDFSKLIIYQLHVGTWWAAEPAGADARGSRSGRFLDVAVRLGYLRDLGINAIQLLPIQEFETEFSEGYNGVDYFSPEGRYLASAEADLALYLDQINALLSGFGPLR